MNVLIIGSNFGSKIYLNCVNELLPNAKITICSPNILKKKIYKSNIKKLKSYEEAFYKNNFSLVICATSPLVQSNVIKFIHKKKIKIQGIVIEKPVAENYKKTKECINLLKKNKIPFVINFIFTQMLKQLRPVMSAWFS